MFESATWTRRSRRLFAVTERLAHTAGITLPVELDDAEAESELAFVTVRQVGLQLGLHGSILVFSMWTTNKLREAAHRRRLYSSLARDSGERAAVLLTRATALLLLRPAGPEVERKQIEVLDAMIGAIYPLPDEDAEFLDTAKHEMRRAERDPYLQQALGADGGSFNNAIGVFSLRAIEIASGYQNARRLPQFRRLGNIGWRELFADHQNAEWRLFVDTVLPRAWLEMERDFVECASVIQSDQLP